jgi:mitochondrial fission protein ELM1
LGEKQGDNAQIMNLAEATGWPFETRQIVVRPRWVTGKPRVQASLGHVDLERSDRLEAPWPDLIITAGRRLACVGLWVKRASAGQTRLVMIGRPRHRLDQFDLSVAAGHYVVPPGPNVVQHELPMMQVDPQRLERATQLWHSRLSVLPRPLTALMVGGPTGGLRFDLEAAQDLFRRTLDGVRESNGSLYITTSRRTPRDVVEMLRQECPDSARLFEYRAGASPNENPYHALLGLADRFVVTTDSVSMMVEVARLGRSLAIYPLEAETNLIENGLAALGLLRPFCPTSDPNPAGGFLARALFRLGWPIHSRDLSAIPQRLVERGLASWLGDAWVHPSPFVDRDLEVVTKRIRALI